MGWGDIKGCNRRARLSWGRFGGELSGGRSRLRANGSEWGSDASRRRLLLGWGRGLLDIGVGGGMLVVRGRLLDIGLDERRWDSALFEGGRRSSARFCTRSRRGSNERTCFLETTRSW